MAIMYNRPMTKEEEERMMMAQSLKNNNMMMADSNSAVRASDFNSLDPSSAVRISEYPADYTTGPTLIPPGADMSQYNDVTGSMLAPPVDSTAPIMTPQEQISPMGTPVTPEQIDEEIMRLQILKNQMMGN